MSGFDVVEASIAELRAALEDGRATSESLTRAYLDRIEAYDRPSTGSGTASTGSGTASTGSGTVAQEATPE